MTLRDGHQPPKAGLMWTGYVLTLTVAVVLAVGSDLRSQGQSAPPLLIPPARVEIASRAVTVYYDLASTSPVAEFNVSLEASLDGGATFSVKPVSVTGDVGPNVKPGSKRIVWQAAHDSQVLQLERFTFRVVAQLAPTVRLGVLVVRTDPAG